MKATMRHLIIFVLSLLWIKNAFGADSLFIHPAPYEYRHFSFNSFDKEIEEIKKLVFDYPDSARKLAEISLQTFSAIGYQKGLGQIYNIFGRLEENRGSYDSAILYYEKSIFHLQYAADNVNITAPFINIANIYFFKGAYDKALEKYYEALAVGKRYNREITQNDSLRLYLNIALAWDNMGSKMQAEETMKIVEQFSILFRDSVYLADYYAYASHIYESQNPRQAIAYLKKAAEVSTIQHLNEILLASLNTLASIYIELEHTDSALYYLKWSKTILDKYPNGYNYQHFHYQNQLGKALIQKKEYAKAEKILLDLYEQIKDRGILDILIHLEKDLSDLFFKEKKYELAFYHNNNYAKQKEALYESKSSRALELWIKLQNMEKENKIFSSQLQIEKQQNEIRQKNTFIIAISIIICLLSLLIFNLIRNHKIKQNVQQNELNQLAQKLEIERLQSYINGEEEERNRIAIELHDNIGSLLSTAIYKLNSTNKQNISLERLDKIGHIIKSAGSEIRKTAHRLLPDLIKNQSLIEAVSQYCAFFENETGIQIYINEQGTLPYLNPELKLTLFRIIQELLQNILKHANASSVLIQIHSGSEIISVTVEDNGIGFDKKDLKEGRGLENIRNRLRVLGGIFYFDSSLGQGSSFYMEI